ncbi:MAG: CehA/McbA family metallohydrolase [Dehalococcoidia bacterium]
MLIDLHTHTFPLSDDSLLSPDQLIDRAKAVGLDGVCLTEHDFVWDPDKVRELAERHNFLVIPGIEVNTEDGHIIVFGLNRYVYGMHRVAELAEMVTEAGGAMIAPHPYRRLTPFLRMDDDFWAMALERAAGNPAFQYVCAVEAINGRASQNENIFAWQLCAHLGLPAVAGSDAHELRDVGTCATRFQHPIAGLEDLVRELKAGRFHAVNLGAKSGNGE